MDNRAQSVGIARFMLGLAVGAFMFWIVTMVTAPLFERSAESSDASIAVEARDLLQVSTEYYIVGVLLISVMGLIVYSVYIREVQR